MIRIMGREFKDFQKAGPLGQRRAKQRLLQKLGGVPLWNGDVIMKWYNT